MGRREATLEACRLRLRPIIMTSMAFILGVVPLILSNGAGAEMRRILGTAVFAGMLGVTLFGIFLTPVFFYVIDSLSQAHMWSWAGFKQVHDYSLSALRWVREIYTFGPIRRYASRRWARRPAGAPRDAVPIPQGDGKRTHEPVPAAPLDGTSNGPVEGNGHVEGHVDSAKGASSNGVSTAIKDTAAAQQTNGHVRK